MCSSHVRSREVRPSHGRTVQVRFGEDPDAIRVCYQYSDSELTYRILLPGTDPTPCMEQLITDIVVPISAVRAYRGSTLVKEILVRMHGSG